MNNELYKDIILLPFDLVRILKLISLKIKSWNNINPRLGYHVEFLS